MESFRNRVERYGGSLLYYLTLALPFVVAAMGIVITIFSADLMDFRGRTSHKYYTVGVYYYNETSHQRELSNKRLLGKPGQIEYSGIISLLVAGLVCTLVGVIVGGLVVGHRYSLLKLQLADTKKYNWILPTCVILDAVALVVIHDVAMVTGQSWALGTRNYTWFNPDYLVDLASRVPDYELWMYNPPFTFNPIMWTCTLRYWAVGAGRHQFGRYCLETSAAVPMAIVLACLLALQLGLHIWAWISSKNKTPLFASDPPSDVE